MKRSGYLAAAALVLIGGCGSKTPTSPTNPTVVILTAQLAPGNEVPAVTNADSTARGDVRVTLDLIRDGSGTITGGTASFFVTLTGFPAGTNVVGAHVHPGAAGNNGSVVISTGITGASAVNLPSGATSLVFNGITTGVTATLLNDILNNPAGYYFNVHTTLNPGGAIRGQLVKQ
jgi:CHRD domain-containing protein